MKAFALFALVLLAACAAPAEQPADGFVDVSDETAAEDIEGELGDLETIDQDLDYGDLETLEQDLEQI